MNFNESMREKKTWIENYIIHNVTSSKVQEKGYVALIPSYTHIRFLAQKNNNF